MLLTSKGFKIDEPIADVILAFRMPLLISNHRQPSEV